MKAWFLEQVTLPNLILLVTATFGLGGYYQAFRTLEMRVTTLEQQRVVDLQFVAETYQRQDVRNEAWQYMREQLQDIKEEIENLRRAREIR